MWIPADAYAARRGRRQVDRLARVVPPGRLEDVRLMVSELISNSLVHAGLDETQVVRVRGLVDATTVRVEVIDGGPGFPTGPAVSPPVGQTSGRGLLLVEALSDRWGAERSGDSWCVWFELRRA